MSTLFISPLVFGLGWGEIVLIVLVILLLFGGKKIPELMKGLGKGVKSFKSGLSEVESEIEEIKKDINKEE
jgi:sec-independent protein translocase protein TatA